MADILVIEDDPDVREVMKVALEDAGHRVREAADGFQGLALTRKHNPALVVTDMVMPHKEGVEVIRELRRQFPNIAILAVSGVAEKGFYLHIASLLGADAVLTKPFKFEDLVAAVSGLLNGSPLLQHQP